MKRVAAVLSILTLVAATGCKTTRAPVAASGQKIQISVLLDRGAEGLDERRAKYREQLGVYMERDLVRRLTRAGYAVSQIRDEAGYKAAPDSYLLAVKVTSYNPGSKAARMLVGYGAGATSINIHYELRGKDAAPLLAKDDGVGSSRDWTFCVVKLDQNIVAAVTGQLAGGSR